MTRQQTGNPIYFALALAILAAIMSTADPGTPRGVAHFPLMTSTPEAYAAAGAIGEDPDAVTPP